MKETLKEIADKAVDLFMKMTKKFDGISEQIYAKTGKKINVGIIVGGVVLFLITIFLVKTILGFIWGTLNSGSF